jgi:hypothetical protein
MKPRPVLAFFAVLGTLYAPAASGEQAPDPRWQSSIVEENDAFIGDLDEHYTQGLRIGLISGELAPGDWGRGALTALARTIFFPTGSAGRVRYGLFAGQSIFTPENTQLSRPDPRDRPYAGWLYGGAKLMRQNERVLDRAEITIGLVGPGAAAAHTQNSYHELTFDYLEAGRVNGWGHQLRNEPGLILTYGRSWRLAGSLGPFEVDALPEAEAALGNIFTYASAGGMLRFGQRLGIDWGPPRIEPAISGSDFVNREALRDHWLAWYLFAGTEGRLIAQNIFLDGNTSRSGPHVDKKPVVADFTIGAAAITPHGRLAASYTRRTPEFDRQDKYDQFVSFSASVRF